MKLQYIFLTIVFCLSAITANADANVNTTIKQFRYSKSMSERLIATNVIIANETKYKNLVLTELHSYATKPTKTPDALLNLAAFMKDETHARFLTNLINNDGYSSKHCIYRCSLVFSLVIFNSFSNYVLRAVNDKLSAVHDLPSEIGQFKDIPIEPEKASEYATGPGIDQLLLEMETLLMSDAIKITGPETTEPARSAEEARLFGMKE